MSAPDKPARPALRINAEWILPLSVAAVGMLGLSDEFWPRRALASAVSVHGLFGTLLAVFVVVRFHARLRAAPCACGAEIRQVSRQLSRTVYVLLAVLVLFKALTDSGIGDLKDYFADALASLILIRAMALAHWHKARRSARQRRLTPQP